MGHRKWVDTLLRDAAHAIRAEPIRLRPAEVREALARLLESETEVRGCYFVDDRLLDFARRVLGVTETVDVYDEAARLRAQMMAGADPTPVSEEDEFSPAQWVHGFVTADGATRQKVAESVLGTAARALECLLGDHKHKIAAANAEIARLHKQVQALQRPEGGS